MTFHLYLSLCLTSFTTGSVGDIEVPGGSIRALPGGILENWLLEARAQHCDDVLGVVSQKLSPLEIESFRDKIFSVVAEY